VSRKTTDKPSGGAPKSNPEDTVAGMPNRVRERIDGYIEPAAITKPRNRKKAKPKAASRKPVPRSNQGTGGSLQTIFNLVRAATQTMTTKELRSLLVYVQGEVGGKVDTPRKPAPGQSERDLLMDELSRFVQRAAEAEAEEAERSQTGDIEAVVTDSSAGHWEEAEDDAEPRDWKEETATGMPHRVRRILDKYLDS